MAILALEEINKLLFYCHCKRQGECVTEADMSNLRRHAYKLAWVTKSVIQSMEAYLRIPGAVLPLSEWYVRQRIGEIGETLLHLDKVKQMSMYHDQRNGRTLTLQSVESRESMELILIFLLGFVEHLANYEALRQMFGDRDGLVRYSDEMLGSDLWARVSDYVGLCATPAYDGIIRQAMDAIDRVWDAQSR